VSDTGKEATNIKKSPNIAVYTKTVSLHTGTFQRWLITIMVCLRVVVRRYLIGIELAAQLF